METSTERGVPIRLVGGVAIFLHADPLHPAFAREYKDIDLVTLSGMGRNVAELVETLNYEPVAEFNALNGHRRLKYTAAEGGGEIDIFVGEFSMCHEIPITERIERDPLTLPLAELLLTKLQIYELGERDMRDALALLHHHELASHDDDAINIDRIAELCAADWGLWRTTCLNLDRLTACLADVPLNPSERDALQARIDDVHERLKTEPKTRRWRMRARIGERKRWYELPEEVG
ncbi:MAG: hypothetical protein ACRDL3_10350 [Solirubrobacterales bacterium]